MDMDFSLKEECGHPVFIGCMLLSSMFSSFTAICQQTTVSSRWRRVLEKCFGKHFLGSKWLVYTVCNLIFHLVNLSYSYLMAPPLWESV